MYNIEILNIFRKEKSLMELEEVLPVVLPDKEVLAMMKEIADCQGMLMLLNRAGFLTNKRVFNK
jgi:hypothetical protein